MQSSAATWRGHAWTCDGDSVTFAVAAAGPCRGAPGAKVTGERDRSRMSGSITQPDEAKIRVGVSACLVGDKVRYDGGHKRDVYLTGKLAQVFEFMPVCPEVAIGMGVPRPPIRLVGDALAPRALGVEDASLDVTAPLTAYGRRMAVELDGISAYIFKARSPSCGPWRVPIYSDGVSMAQGTGLYAREIRARQSLLPVEEEGRLADPSLRDNFIERIFAYRRWQQLQTSGIDVGALVEFHSAHKLQLMSHGAVYYRALGRLIAEAKPPRIAAVAREYGAEFMSALTHPATRKRHTNVLHHLMGYLKRHLDREDKVELLGVIESYRLGQMPLAAPITLLKHHFRRFPDPYIDKQTYLHPHPTELALRSGA